MNTKRMALESDIAGLKQILASTDYQALKHADGALSDEEYEATRQYRQSLRDQINEIESEVMAIEESGEEDAE